MGKTSIEWTDRTWNPTRGCSRVSEGCRNCYAERQAARFSNRVNYGAGEYFADDSGTKKPGIFDDLVVRTLSGPRWTGKVELIESKLTEPLHWRKPARIFVNSMSDLFHEALPDEAIDRVFAVMALSPQHTFQVLTKRPKLMLEWARLPRPRERDSEWWTEWRKLVRKTGRLDAYASCVPAWPLPNVWLGVSVEDQKTADERIPLLLQTPAAVRFVSYEPALSNVNFSEFFDPLRREDEWGKLSWLIIGGESGPGARPFDIAWARQTIAQCKAAGVACFVKQLGAHPIDSQHEMADWPNGCQQNQSTGAWLPVLLDCKGGLMEEWPADLRVRQFPEARHA